MWNPGELDPNNIDTDGDNVQDGTEIGLSGPEGGGTGSIFIPDADGGLTTTDPLDPDTDGGGLSDGEEDDGDRGGVAYNGKIDGTETDPNNWWDDVTRGVTITETSGSTEVEEKGLTDTYSIVLDGPPEGIVVVTATSTDTVTGVQVDQSSLTFTLGDWDIPQLITVSAVDDGVNELDLHYTDIVHDIDTEATTDPAYDSYAGTLPSITVSIADAQTLDSIWDFIDLWFNTIQNSLSNLLALVTEAQARTDDILFRLDTGLDVPVSSRASQSSVDDISDRLAQLESSGKGLELQVYQQPTKKFTIYQIGASLYGSPVDAVVDTVYARVYDESNKIFLWMDITSYISASSFGTGHLQVMVNTPIDIDPLFLQFIIRYNDVDAMRYGTYLIPNENSRQWK